MKSKIYEILNEKLERALEIIEDGLCGIFPYPNVLLDSKDMETVNQFIEEWAKENNVNLFIVTDGGYEIRNAWNMVTVDHVTKACIAPTKEQIEKLNKPKTVLLLKDLHKMEDKTYRDWLYKFIVDGIVADESKQEGYTILKNLLFTIVTVGDMPREDLYGLVTKCNFSAMLDLDEK